jgi:hypothetical protein
MESTKDSSPTDVAAPPILAGAWGERGLAPYFRSKVSIGAEARTRVGKADAHCDAPQDSDLLPRGTSLGSKTLRGRRPPTPPAGE